MSCCCFQLPLSGSPNSVDRSDSRRRCGSFNSLSRDHKFIEQVTTKPTLVVNFQLPLSGSRSDALLLLAELSASATFQLPLSGSPYVVVPFAEKLYELSTPSLGITS